MKHETRIVSMAEM